MAFPDKLKDDFIIRSDLTALSSRFQGRIGRRIVHLRKTSSTMDVARRIVDSSSDAGQLHGTVVVADEQSQGRGRFGRVWDSQRCKDILTSIILCPRISLTGQFTALGPLACALTVDRFTGAESGIKWPNDVLVDGRKISGMIAESITVGDWFAAILGIGLNVNSMRADDASTGYRATSMFQVARHPQRFDRAEVLSVLLECINELYDAVDRGETIIPEWRSKLSTLGGEVRVSDATPGGSGKTIRGVAEDVDDFGRLLIRERDGTLRAVAAGEVTMRSPERT